MSDMSDDGCTQAMREKVAELCRYIEGHADAKLSLDAMGKRVDASPHHL